MDLKKLTPTRLPVNVALDNFIASQKTVGGKNYYSIGFNWSTVSSAGSPVMSWSTSGAGGYALPFKKLQLTKVYFYSRKNSATGAITTPQVIFRLYNQTGVAGALNNFIPLNFSSSPAGSPAAPSQQNFIEWTNGGTPTETPIFNDLPDYQFSQAGFSWDFIIPSATNLNDSFDNFITIEWEILN